MLSAYLKYKHSEGKGRVSLKNDKLEMQITASFISSVELFTQYIPKDTN